MQKSIKMQVVVGKLLLLLSCCYCYGPAEMKLSRLNHFFTQDKVAKVLAIKEKRIFISLGI